MNKKINKLIIFSIFVVYFLIQAPFALSQSSCPENTTVSGTTANLVGEVNSHGGDPDLNVWFEYGLTTDYSSTTPTQQQEGLGKFCYTISNLNPCTTYNYRAIAQNSAGTSYGENKSFTTSCSNPTVSLRANNSTGSTTIPYNTSANLTWSSSNTNDCVALGSWSGSKSTSGSQSTGNLTSSKTYNIECTGSGGSVSDSVTVNVEQSQPEELSISCYANPRSIFTGESTTFIAEASGGTGSYTYAWSRACSGRTSMCNKNFSFAGNYKAFLTVSSGSETKVTSCFVTVEREEDLNVSCYASPSSIREGESTTFRAEVSGGIGSYAYTWSGDCSGSSENCTRRFYDKGSRAATIRVDSGSQTRSATCYVDIEETKNLSVSAYASPSSIREGESTTFRAEASGGTGSYTYSWSGACSGNSRNCTRTFHDQGTRTATVRVTSGGQTRTSTVSVNITKEELNDLNVSCYASPSSIREGESTTFRAEASGGTGSYTYTWLGDCTGNLRNCTRVFNSRGFKAATIRVVSGNQIKATSCFVSVLPGQATYTRQHTRRCYNNNVYWYDSEGTRQEKYEDCDDGNECTLNFCEDGACVNELKCDGSTCAISSADYCNYCDSCGDGICNCGYTVETCPEDCQIIGLALTVFGRR